jgi:NADPH:quinone reductase-like Zn-dependent oxidoreductase
MKAVFIKEHGGLEALTFGDRPEPEVGPGEVMLRVGASALNRLDMGLRAGRSYRGPLPRIMGCDIAGEIVQISPEARTDVKVGDRVVLDNRVKCTGNCEYCVRGQDQFCSDQKRLGVDLDGGHAEFITAPAMNAFKFPDSMSFTEAAALPLAGHTAWHCLVTQGQIRPWDDVLIHAASSGVASMGIQMPSQ